MDRLRVSLRILIGFGAVLLLLAAVGVSGILGSGRTLDHLAHYADGANLTVTVMQAQNRSRGRSARRPGLHFQRHHGKLG
jgi:hypothetical protein